MSDAPTFEHLISPVTVPVFLDQHWERTPLLLERKAFDHYQSIVGVADIDRLFESRQHRTEFVRVLRNGEISDHLWSETLTLRDGRVMLVTDFEKVTEQFHKGASIVINGAHRSVPVLRELTARLGAELGCGLQANIYITPAGAQTLRPHYDLHDAFLLQINGVKHWRLYHREEVTPVVQTGLDQEAITRSDPTIEGDLEPGDALYIPSGFVHAAVTSDSPSVHVTLGIKPQRGFDVFAMALERAKTLPELRRAQPLKIQSQAERESRLRQLKAALDDVWAEIWSGDDPFANAVPRTGAFVRPGAGLLTRALEIDGIAPSTLIRLGPDVVVSRSKNAAELVLTSGNGQHTVSAVFAPAIESLGQADGIRVEEMAGLLTGPGKVELARTLARAGMVEVVRG